MPIPVIPDVMLTRRKMKSKDLAAHSGITWANLSLLKQDRVKDVRFETLAAIRAAPECRPGELPEYRADGGDINRECSQRLPSRRPAAMIERSFESRRPP